MFRPRFLVLPLLLLLASACGDDDDDGDPTDSSAGGDSSSVDDAAPPDTAPPDAAPLDGPTDPPLAPDLTLYAPLMDDSLYIDTIDVAPDSCALIEGCVGGPGQRRVLRFQVASANIGNQDLTLGTPDPVNPNWIYSECHDHYHWLGFANYELLDATSSVVASGHKQAFCLLDLYQLDDSKPGQGFTCEYQGISAGWADVYDPALDCQWVDVTDVPAGDYTLRVQLNPEKTLFEGDYTNNEHEIPVTLD